MIYYDFFDNLVVAYFLGHPVCKMNTDKHE